MAASEKKGKLEGERPKSFNGRIGKHQESL